ncbi:MAG: hypothetical protein M0Z99_25700 [Betaproteobacteria bacterium]|nr:hypothetical protein [Betaproteobacteria bacterium]
MKTLIAVVSLTLATLTGCVQPPVRPELTGSIVNDFMQRKAPDSGGRVYVTMGTYRTPLITVDRGWDSGDLFINNMRVETVNNTKEYIVIDLQPGQYVFTWLPLAGYERSKTGANPLIVTVQDGQTQFLALDAIEGTNWLSAFGAIGAAAGVNRVTDVRKEITSSVLEGRRPVSYFDLRNQKL